MRMVHRVVLGGALALGGAGSAGAVAAADAMPAAAPGSAAGYVRSGGSVVVTGASGASLRITPYGPYTVRLQTVRKGEAYFPDDYYEMVDAKPHGALQVGEQAGALALQLPGGSPGGVPATRIVVDRQTLAVTYFMDGKQVLAEQGALQWQDGRIVRSFAPDAGEHYTALGHGYYGRAESIDLKGQELGHNYGSEQIQQAPLLVPFYLSSKGYGVFLNSTFKNRFSFGANGRYEFGIDTPGYAGRMDYFFIAGPAPRDVLAHYVELTGKPRLPPKSMFGLALSDKSHDHDSATPSDEAWWKQKVGEHRAAGFPIDHIVNDNRWRAGGGKRCESYLEWDSGRYPHPDEYARWLKQNGLVTTIDVNRCILQYSEGWKPSFNVPAVSGIDFADSAPDQTNPAFRKWFWDVLYRKSLDPKLHYPGDALWIDEFDEMGGAPASTMLANGRSFAEMRNYWFFLIAQALVRDGWDKSAITQRPYVWVRGMTAGAQRYASLWSGDIKPNFEEMKMQIRGMQLAGLSGFPYWGHDAGGFYDWEAKLGPDADLYRQWAMGFGAFAPIWKPHGMGPSRWPLDRSAGEQAAARQFAQARYQLMPYIYSAAHEAAVSGLPMARAMLLDYPHDDAAWRHDLQYMWGPSLLVAPRTSRDGATEVWLPAGGWYDYWNPQAMRLVGQGGEVVSVAAGASGGGVLPVFVKAGAVLPRQPYSTSTASAGKEKMLLDVYIGAAGSALLQEDDDVSEAYRKRGQLMTTAVDWNDAARTLTIGAARGSYAGAPAQRSWQVTLHGAAAAGCYLVNGRRTEATPDAASGALKLQTAPASIRKAVTIRPCS
jgi:alpha-D-xyloside xylohydrolase